MIHKHFEVCIIEAAIAKETKTAIATSPTLILKCNAIEVCAMPHLHSALPCSSMIVAALTTIDNYGFATCSVKHD